MELPIDSIARVETWADMTHRQDLSDPAKAVRFYSKQQSSVKAVYKGKVIAVSYYDDLSFIVVKFGNYFIGYANIVKPQVKKGDKIKTSDFMGLCGKDLNEEFCVEIFLSNDKQEINPADWFIRYCLKK